MSLLNFSRLLFNRQDLLLLKGNFHNITLVRALRQQTRNTEVKKIVTVQADPIHRSEKIDVDTSIKYLDSEAYKQSYGDNFIWELYRRNQTRHFLGKTRKTCIRKEKISTASPCPICRDMYLVLHHENIKLLQQFISPYSGEILPTKTTGLCRRQHEQLIIAVMNAKEYGTISFDVPFRKYDYEYFKNLGVKADMGKN